MRTLLIQPLSSIRLYKIYVMACGNSGNNGCTGENNDEIASSRRIQGSRLALALRMNFVSLKRQLEGHIGDRSFLDFLTADERLKLRICGTDIDKVDYLLKCILRKSEECWGRFMEYLLDKRYIQERDLQKVKKMNEEPINQMFSISDFAKDEFSDYLKKELEVIGVLDYLFEWCVIELVDHDTILESNPRSVQVQKILEILKQRDERCLKTFCYILKQHSHPRIIKQLQILKEPISSPLEDDDIPAFSSSIKVHADVETEQALIQQSIEQINSTLTDDGITVVGTRNGCVEFILLSRPEKDCLQLSTSEQVELCLRFLQNLISIPAVKQTVAIGQTFKMTVQHYDNALPLISPIESTLQYRLAVQLSRHSLQELIDVPSFIDIFSSGGFIDEELREDLHTTKDEQLKKEYIIHVLSCFDESRLTEMLTYSRQRKEMKTVVDEIEKWRCLECYRKTILDAYIDIEDVIDTDIMRKTLKNQPEVPTVITHICIDQADSLSRVKRAIIFLQYILANRDILLSFAIEFTKRSRLVLKHSLCDNCSSRPKKKTHGPPNSVEFNFIIRTNEMGDLSVFSNGLSDIRTTIPGAHMTSEEDSIRILLFGKLTKRNQLIMNILPKEIPQRLARQLGEMPTAKRLHIGHKQIICTEMPDLTVRSSVLENVIAKLTAKISPGPHIIMVILSIFDENPMVALRELKDFFGDDILKHILLVFITEGHLDLNKTKSLKVLIEQRYRSALIECNNHYMVVPSKTTNTSIKHVEDQFAETIEQITQRNGMIYFTNANMKNIEAAILNYMDEMTNHLYNASLKEKTKMLQEIEKEEESSEKVLDLRKRAIDDLLYIDSLQHFNSRTLEAAKNMLSEFEMRTRKSLELT